MSIFHKSSYAKRADGKPWTKNALLKQMLDEIGLDIKMTGNDFIITEKPYVVGVAFGASNYAVKEKIELVGSLYIQGSQHYQTWEDLFNVCKEVYGEKYRALEIYKDQAWEGSSIQRECHEVYRPLFKGMQDPECLVRLAQGEPFRLERHEITMWPIKLT